MPDVRARSDYVLHSQISQAESYMIRLILPRAVCFCCRFEPFEVRSNRTLGTNRLAVALAAERLDGLRARGNLEHHIVAGCSRTAHAPPQPVLVGLPHLPIAAANAATIRTHERFA
jgi:hypothetical protein